MLMNTKEQSPLGEFKDFYFSDSGRTGLINLLNSTIYEIVQNSICGDKKRIELKFLFSFYSKQFVICDYDTNVSELRPVKKMDDFLLLGSFYLNRNLKLYKNLVEIFPEFDFDEVKLKPEIDKLSAFIIDNYLNPEVSKLILESYGNESRSLKERVRVCELKNGEFPIRLLNKKDLLEFLLIFADYNAPVNKKRIKKIDFQSFVSEEVYDLILNLFKDFAFDSLKTNSLYELDFDSFYNLHSLGLLSDETIIKLFNKIIYLNKTETIRSRRIFEFFVNCFSSRYYSLDLFTQKEVLSFLSDEDLLNLLESFFYLINKLAADVGTFRELIVEKIMPEVEIRKLKVTREFFINERSFVLLLSEFNLRNYFFNNFSTVTFEISKGRLIKLFLELTDKLYDERQFKKLISLIEDVKVNGLSFKISDEAKNNLEQLIKSVDSGLIVSESDYIVDAIKSFYKIVD